MPISDELAELALNLRWSWNDSSDELWRAVDEQLWELTRNPWVVLQTVSPEKLHSVGFQPEFQKKLNQLLEEKRIEDRQPSWFGRSFPDSPLTSIAYFSMEFMLSEALPIYSGGLGNVAGDQLKAASDLGVPVTAVGLLYQQGYFRQHIDADGKQLALYPFNDPGQLPIRPLRKDNNEWLRIPMPAPGGTLWIRTWEVSVGRAKLYLLDTNDPANLPEYRGITSELYGDGPELRIRQEAVLGIGGWRLLRALGIEPQVCHLNEGHAAFAVVERARSYMTDEAVSFQQALLTTRTGNLFTTHTPVEAGFDYFASDLMKAHFHDYVTGLGIDFQDFLALGRRDANDRSEPFNMAYLAIRGSAAVNGVSRLHGEVSRKLFQRLYPRWPEVEVPVGHVTNGVHVPTWISKEAEALWTEAPGEAEWNDSTAHLRSQLRQVPDDRLWRMRTDRRSSLVNYVRKRLARQLAGHGASPDAIEQVRHLFDPDVLTLGFARRFATYKRPNLLLQDPDRLLRLLTDREKPVQLILAGKAHPQDIEGQEMIRQWIHFIRQTTARSRVAFLSDYDMDLTEHLVQGVDLWLNTPRRPWEASGTSGMKVLANGGLNLSELDGWWAEAYSPEVGWAIGDGGEHDGDPAWDRVEAETLYALLEREIIPEFYTRNRQGIPQRWVIRMRESMARLTPAYSASRAVREYTAKYYLPCAEQYLQRVSGHGKLSSELLSWSNDLSQGWAKLRFGSLHVGIDKDVYDFQVQVYLGELNEHLVRVELYAEGIRGEGHIAKAMTQGPALAGSANAYTYQLRVNADRPMEHFTPRIIPYHPGSSVPLEAQQILWYR